MTIADNAGLLRLYLGGKRDFPLTEAGNAERFAYIYGPRLRYSPRQATWFTWSQTHWEADPGEVRVQTLVKDSNRSIAADAPASVDPREYQAILTWAKASDRFACRVATIKGARSEVNVVDPAQMDAQSMLLNVKNGTIDLESGRLRDHDPDDLFTRVVSIDFDPNADCPRMHQFLAEVLPDAETVEFVWRAIGYGLTGSTAEHALFLAYGSGANGKSVLFNVLTELFGPFGGPADANLLLAKHGEAHPVGLADLHGKRFVSCQEIGAGRRWDDATLKWLTGGDRISARRMRENLWSFEPTHKLWVATNAKPQASSTDAALWRRIKLIPFERVFSPDKRDTNLLAKLRAELPGILRRAVEACLRWQKDGLAEPSAVTAATGQYRSSTDPLAGFLADRCVLGGTEKVSRKELFAAYEAWCSDNGDDPLSAKAFATRLRGDSGFGEGKVRTPTGPRDAWTGLRLRGRSDVVTCSDHLPAEDTRESEDPAIPETARYTSLHTTNGDGQTERPQFLPVPLSGDSR